MKNQLQKTNNWMEPTSMSEAMELAKMLSSSQFVPDTFRGKPGDVVAAIGYGASVGLAPLQALQSIAVVNGKPCVWGDGMLAICQGHPDFVDMIESVENDTATCVVKRKGRSDVIRTYSKKDAETAGLWDKSSKRKNNKTGEWYEIDSPWKKYPKRMLQMRARGFALRDAFADALKGIISREEAGDYPEKAGTSNKSATQRVMEKIPASKGVIDVDFDSSSRGKFDEIMKLIEDASCEGHLEEIVIRIKKNGFDEDMKTTLRDAYVIKAREMKSSKSVDT